MRWSALGVALGIAACGGAASPGRSVAVRDSAGITIVTYPQGVVTAAPVWHAGRELVTLGGLEADSIHDMSGLTSAELTASGFVVADRQTVQLRAFDSTGALVATGAGRGGGPGELDEMGTLVRDPGGVAVIDFFKGRFVRYDDSLRFRDIRSLRDLPGGSRNGVLFAADNGSLEFAGGPRRRPEQVPAGQIVRPPSVVERIASDTGPVDTLFSVPNVEFYFIARLGTRARRFGLRSFVRRTRDGFISGDGAHWQFAIRDTAGAVRRLVRLDWPRRVVTEPMRAEQLRLDHQEIDDLPAGGFVEIRQMAEIDFADPHFPDSLPPYQNSVLGSDGTLFLLEGTAPTDSFHHWFAFHGDSLLGVLELPASLRLMDARRDRLLLRRTDSLDIGYLELRAITTP